MAFSCLDVAKLVPTPISSQLNGTLHLLMAQRSVQFLRSNKNMRLRYVGTKVTQLKCDWARGS